MALLTAKLDPAVVFADIKTTETDINNSIGTYTRISSTRATITLFSETATGPSENYTLTIFGSNLPASLTNPGALGLIASINKLTIARNNAPANTLFSWDGKGETITFLELADAVDASSTNERALLQLFLEGVDTLDAEYENVDITLLPELENISLVGSAKNAIGNAANNLIKGNEFGNLISCGAGNDEARGLNGEDTMNGGEGGDVLLGGLSNDRLNGELGNDSLGGGNGRDTMNGGVGRDQLIGGFGRNVFEDSNDGFSDLMVIRADQTLSNPIDPAGGEKCDLIGRIDTIDKIIIQGVTTQQITFQSNFTWTPPGGGSVTGIAIFAAGKLEALCTDPSLTLQQLQACTSGDASTAAINNTLGFYTSW